MFRSPLRFFWFLLVLFLLPCSGLAADLPDYTPDANTGRSDVPDAYKWNLTQLFAAPESWEEELDALRVEMGGLSSYQGRLTDPAALTECLDLYFDLHDRASHVTQYANLALDSEQTNQEFQARQQRGLVLMDEFMAAAGFIRGEVLALDDKTMELAYQATDGPAKYRSYLDNLRRRQSRVLGAEAEKILQLVGDNL